MRHIIWIFWPAFIAAGIAETIFFTMIDPHQLYLFGKVIEWPPVATYSTGFLLFWLVCTGSSLLTYFMLPAGIKDVLIAAAGAREDLSRPLRQRKPS